MTRSVNSDSTFSLTAVLVEEPVFASVEGNQAHVDATQASEPPARTLDQCVSTKPGLSASPLSDWQLVCEIRLVAFRARTAVTHVRMYSCRAVAEHRIGVAYNGHDCARRKAENNMKHGTKSW